MLCSPYRRQHCSSLHTVSSKSINHPYVHSQKMLTPISVSRLLVSIFFKHAYSRRNNTACGPPLIRVWCLMRVNWWKTKTNATVRTVIKDKLTKKRNKKNEKNYTLKMCKTYFEVLYPYCSIWPIIPCITLIKKVITSAFF